MSFLMYSTEYNVLGYEQWALGIGYWALAIYFWNLSIPVLGRDSKATYMQYAVRKNNG
ncbi:hypothetical protein L228DRAFT_243414 [Xylona heveae TC161]|uniref:Uncharacterized protein n=1 Tax=Xylona heveae (strain CBS 132557 / TC161) TaxID=1328760 RepID=A0A165K1H4_XYLHT|nr:hypothetical protein L228DRAFT_243414 [Xylona heveae TC161]KZF26882.1 hypothetical protein L228DRAFT_243414 [Xylona heveae TC161]